MVAILIQNKLMIQLKTLRLADKWQKWLVQSASLIKLKSEKWLRPIQNLAQWRQKLVLFFDWLVNKIVLNYKNSLYLYM